MQNINIDNGLMSFTINNDTNRVISFNPSDIGIIERIQTVISNISDYATNDLNVDDIEGKSELENTALQLDTFKKYVCEQIDYIFNAPISDVAFGGQNPLSPVGGIPLYERFLEAVVPIIQSTVIKEQKASQKRIEQYTKLVR